MECVEVPRERLGEMLVSLGLITKTQLDEALGAQRRTRLPIGKQLVMSGAVSEIRLTQVLSNQLSVPWVSLERVEFPAELLARISGDLADRYSVMPIYVRNVRGRGATLYVAMDDPTDEEALKTVAEEAGLPVRPMIAPPSELRRVIEQRYFGAPIPSARPATEAALRAAAPGSSKQRASIPDNGRSGKQPRAIKPPPPPGPASVKLEGLVPIEQYETPSQPPGHPGRVLTLLDGTQITLPAVRPQREAPHVKGVRHVVKAIRSARAEIGADEPLRWHDIVQAILDSVDARGLRLTREEIADAWLRQRDKRESKA